MLKKHRNNLTKLADYLAKLPADYDRFDMRDFNRMSALGGYSLHLAARSYDCGTVACAVGHGPAAGIRVYRDVSWGAYGRRALGIDRWDDRKTFDYLFGYTWVQFDNTPHGAAARIRTYLDSGVPADWQQQRQASR